jgi:hypothetical protein
MLRGIVEESFIVPPLIVKREEIDQGISALDGALQVADKETSWRDNKFLVCYAMNHNACVPHLSKLPERTKQVEERAIGLGNWGNQLTSAYRIFLVPGVFHV